MTTVLLDSITEGERARQEYRNLDALADSIRELGVLSPVALTPDFRLVCGGRRVLEVSNSIGDRHDDSPVSRGAESPDETTVGASGRRGDDSDRGTQDGAS